MKPLDSLALAALPAPVGRPNYDRGALRTGILHFGPGAFHRAHQAAYVDRLLESDPRWGIAAVSLRSGDTVEALRRQDGLYTLAILDAQPSLRVLGVHNRFIGTGGSVEVRRLLAGPSVAIVSSTVTEKGYCLAADGSLDFGHPDIVGDLARPDAPVSLIGWLSLGLRLRRSAGAAPFVPLCCDNMVGNGKKLRGAVLAFAERIDPELARWIAGEVRFPDTMVDSITPATDEALRARVSSETGFDDSIPVAREAYSAWVIEDALPAGGPDLAGAGAVLTTDVAGYELAKLRILNGAHSSLAYLGLLAGHETVASVMADRRLAGLVGKMVLEDVIPTIRVRAGMDLEAYADDIFDRFRNPAIRHKLSQIAWDGSQKLPYRLLDTIRDARAAGGSVERLAVPVAAWMRFIQRQARGGVALVDPLADRLAAIGREAGDPEALISRLLDLREIFPAELAQDQVFRDALASAITLLPEPIHA